MDPQQLRNFVLESNKIEGIHREPTKEELQVHEYFFGHSNVTIFDIVALVGTVTGRKDLLRNKLGMNVRIGNYYPPEGGAGIRDHLDFIIEAVNEDRLHPYHTHQTYQKLHPFMDGNGRSGRALWAWTMNKRGLYWKDRGFLHTWYYQSLELGGKPLKPID